MTNGHLRHEGIVIRRLTALLACAVIVGCSTRPDRRPVQADGETAADSIPLDSCAKLDQLGTPQARVLQPGEVIPGPQPGSWADVKRVAFGAFSIEVPAVTTLGRIDSAFVSVVDFPTCRYFCGINVDLVHDSVYTSLDAYVAHWRDLDTVGDPDAERSGPPRPIRVGPDRGLVMETPCGDCGSEDLIVKRGNTVAHISFSMDDREGNQPGVRCRLTRAATTFRWIDPRAGISVRSSNER